MTITTDDIFQNLIEASFRGVPFWMPDSRYSVGRRVQKFMFPGRDDYVWEDLGALDGPMQVSGLLVGDDFVSQAQAMAQAFRTAGPAQLVHPWLGEITVILPQPGTISFDQRHLRLARIEFTVELYDPTQPAPPDTLGAVIAGNADLEDQANNLISAILAPATLSLAAIGVIQAVAGQVATVFLAAVGPLSFVASAIATSVTALQNVGALPLGAGYAAAVGAALAAPGAAVAATSATMAPAAIGPGDAPLPATPQDPRATTAILLSATTQIVALTGSAPTGAAALAAAALTLANAVDASTDIVFTSQEDATAWMTQLVATIDQVAALAVLNGPTFPAAAGPVWRSVQTLRAAVITDISAQLGRLPEVQTFTLIGTTPAWLVAQALVGDTPGQVLGMYQDLVARNNVANPLTMGPGTIEALVA